MASGEDLKNQRRGEEAELARYRQRLEELRVAYDRFFMGLERIPPQRERDAYMRDLRQTNLLRSHNTAIKFQFQNVRERWSSFCRHWDRIMRLIEEGKFRRERNAPIRAPAVPTEDSEPPTVESEAPPAAGSGAEAAGLDSRRVFESWQEAQRQVGRNPTVEYERFVKRLEAQRDKHLAQHGWKDVTYDVRVKDGKVALVARPVKQANASRG